MGLAETAIESEFCRGCGERLPVERAPPSSPSGAVERRFQERQVEALCSKCQALEKRLRSRREHVADTAVICQTCQTIFATLSAQDVARRWPEQLGPPICADCQRIIRCVRYVFNREESGELRGAG